MFIEEKAEVSGKALRCYPGKVTPVWCSFQQPHVQGWLELPIEAFLSKTLAGCFVASFYCVNRGIRRNEIFECCLATFCLVMCPGALNECQQTN